MGTIEDRVAKVLWRSLSGHVEGDHKLEVRRLPEGDIEIHCCWCDRPVMAGSPGIVEHVVNVVKEAGGKITNIRPAVEVL